MAEFWILPFTQSRECFHCCKTRCLLPTSQLNIEKKTGTHFENWDLKGNQYTTIRCLKNISIYWYMLKDSKNEPDRKTYTIKYTAYYTDTMFIDAFI